MLMGNSALLIPTYMHVAMYVIFLHGKANGTYLQQIFTCISIELMGII